MGKRGAVDEPEVVTQATLTGPGPWWELMRKLHNIPGEWAIIAKWLDGEEYDEKRASWLRTRIVQGKAGAVPAGLYELKSKQQTQRGVIIGSALYARFIEERPEGVVEFVKGQLGPARID